MKKLFSFFTLLIFIIIAFFQNPVMSFAMQNMDMSDMEMEMSMNDNMKKDCCSGNEESKQDCNHECCYESAWLTEVSILNSTREENKKIKIKIKSLIDIFSLSLKLHENKKLTKITSPPNKIRKVKNYSYIDLTKIIKSNT